MKCVYGCLFDGNKLTGDCRVPWDMMCAMKGRKNEEKPASPKQEASVENIEAARQRWREERSGNRYPAWRGEDPGAY